ncbi:MAG: metallophosphoesterase [Chryseobacterium sp.]|uniref:metallophosphoesterase family protein n=1 Tax=Chryseobacterium sp. TaxID=1871047 RepID=UPI001B1550B1|nr:metallophosphoesterase [Chryseobacterium sp.]MBO6183433.1 metallophosphoesterase [Chryseobacterium sp.]
MRIIHLSDIHLCADNIEDFRLYYRKSLIKELNKINSQKDIDLIIISGDLVDKGGLSLKGIEGYDASVNQYDIFEKEFITTLCEKIPILKNRFLFIPGNHDIETSKINRIIDADLEKIISSAEDANKVCSEFKSQSQFLGFERLQSFLEFEKKFHKDNKLLKYLPTNFESQAIYEYKGKKIGIALINDSWRCTNRKVANHYVATNQFFRCLEVFDEENTSINIAVMHHPLSVMNESEQEAIENILKNQNFKLLMLGHEHKSRVEVLGLRDQTIFCTRGRSTFDKPHEKEKDYISGFSVIDFDFGTSKITCSYKIYDKNTFSFDDDFKNGSAIEEFIFGVKHEVLNYNVEKFKNNFENE